MIYHLHPISSYYCVGPEKNYIGYGYYVYETKAGMNSLTLKNTGHRNVILRMNNYIRFWLRKLFRNYIVKMNIESSGKLVFNDEKSKL